MKKRIVICCNVYPPNFLGGAELIAHYQAKALKQLGHEVVIFTGDTQHCGKRYSLRREAYGDLTVYRVSLWPTDYQSEFVNFSHREVEQHFDALLEDFSPDVVHLHNLIGLSVGIIHLAKRRKIKTVLTVHDHWGFCYKNTLLKYGAEVCSNYTRCAKCMPFVQDGDGKQIPIRLRRDFLAMQLSEVDVFISPSRYLAEAYIEAGLPASRFKVILYGIDVKRFENLRKIQASGYVRFSYIGHLGRHKGVHTILEALSLLGERTQVRINLVLSPKLWPHGYLLLLRGWVVSLNWSKTVKLAISWRPATRGNWRKRCWSLLLTGLRYPYLGKTRFAGLQTIRLSTK